MQTEGREKGGGVKRRDTETRNETNRGQAYKKKIEGGRESVCVFTFLREEV
jgi:hypothetical protein